MKSQFCGFDLMHTPWSVCAKSFSFNVELLNEYRSLYLRTLPIKGKFHCTADLLYILFWFSCFAYVEWTTVLLVWSNPNQSNRRSAVQWYFPPVVSVLCQLGIVAFWGSTLSSGKQSFTIGNKNDQTDAKDCMWKGLMLLAQDWWPVWPEKIAKCL